MNRLRFLWLFVVLLALSAPASTALAQATLRATMSPSQPFVGQTFEYSVTAYGSAVQIELPDRISPNVTQLNSDPAVSSRTTIINGRTNQTQTFSWGFIADAPGPISFGPATAYSGGQPIKSNEVSGQARAPEKVDLGDLGEVFSGYSGHAALNQALQGDCFAVTEVPNRVYSMQAFQVAVWLYRSRALRGSSYRIAEVTPQFPEPGAKFIRIEEGTGPASRIQWEPVEVNGEPFDRALCYQALLVPTQSGAVELRGGSLKVDFVQASSSSRDPLTFRRNFFDPAISANLPAQMHQIEVASLPPRPDNTVAQLVGNYTIAVKADRDELEEGELLTLSIRVSGRGYLGSASVDNLPELPGFTHQNAEADFKIPDPSNPFFSAKTFKEVYLATKPGTFEIPSLRFAIVSPETGDQKVEETSPMTIRVTPSASSSMELTGAVPGAGIGRARELANSDIVYIDTSPMTWRGAASGASAAYRQPLYLLLHAAALIAVVASVGWKARTRALMKDSRSYRARLSRQKALVHLRESGELVQKGDRDAFYSSLSRGILNSVGAFLGREPSGLTVESIRASLHSRGVGEDLIRELEEFLSQCDAMRYSPSASEGDRQEDLRKARDLVMRLDKEGRK